MTTTSLDEAYAEINSLGGYVAPDDLYGQGYSKALHDALAILERMGAWDADLIRMQEDAARRKAERNAA